MNDHENSRDGDEEEEQKSEQQSAIPLPPSIPVSIAQRFHHDGLHSIFRWLTMRELNAAAQTCKSWYAASISPSFRLDCEVNVGSLHPSFPSSALRHHVRSIRLFGVQTISQLIQLNLAALSNVTKLSVVVNVNARPPSSTSTSSSPLSLLPPHLTSVELDVYENRKLSVEYVRRSVELLMPAVGSCHELENLYICANGSAECELNPLRRLTNLRSAELVGGWLPVGLAEVLRELPLLDDVDIGWSRRDETRDFLRVLCSPHPQTHSRPQLKSLRLGWLLPPDVWHCCVAYQT